MAFILYSSASAGTGSAATAPDSYDCGLVVIVPSGAFTALKLTAPIMNSNNTSSLYDLSCVPLSASTDTRQITITVPGVYLYPSVGGLGSVQLVSNNTTAFTVTANFILKR